ncbi:MAG: hypothetical protein KY475_16235 [Planctomycetes bacterium]|nr:hypothetical protein [Planctomycetota bacterium]
MAEFETDDLDARLEELDEAFDDFDERCLFRSSVRTAGEIYRLAKSGGRVIPYLNAGFKLMNGAQSLLAPDKGRDAAIEVIGMLESEDLARRIQPDFPDDEYAMTVSWMSACGYDNLAKHTAMINGYNSEGMHGCIADGIQVCRRTGKLRCITCFREYAFDVYLAADDLDMAIHFARLTTSMPEDAPGSERRWVAAKNLGRAYLILGKLDEAEEAAHQALSLCESYFRPLDARLDSQVLLEDVLLLAGRHEELSRHIGAKTAPRQLPEGESPAHDLGWDLRDALAACCEGRYDDAIRLLTHWDRWLTTQKCLDQWFEVRLRMIAAHRMAGYQAKIDGLAHQLGSKAKTANDWLTLRRLTRLLDPSETVSPVATAAPITSGPFASKQPAVSAASGEAGERDLAQESTAMEQPASHEEAAATDEQAPTPLAAKFEELAERLDQAGDDEEAFRAVRRDFLAIDPASVTEFFDAVRLLHLARFVVGDGEDRDRLWQWAEAVAARHSENATILSLVAVLGDIIRDAGDPEADEVVDPQRIDELLRQSLRLDPDDPANFARAGGYYLEIEELGEAERCLSRGFRLARDNGYLATRLAEVYRCTDRPRDALAVLDMALREGCDDPGVAWEAMMTALLLDQYDALLTYGDRFEAMQPGQQWTQYYRATALVELGELEDAIQAIEEEERRSPEQRLHLNILRARIAAQQSDAASFRSLLTEVLETPLRSIDFLTFTGLCRLFEKLWMAAHFLPPEDDLRVRLNDRLLAAGLAPDDAFEAVREENPKHEDVNFYRCTLLQPLREDWPGFPGCLAGQEGWQVYHAEWGVLARDEEEAAGLALPWQARCYPQPAEIENIELADEGYTEHVGVVWQGFRWGEGGEE